VARESFASQGVVANMENRELARPGIDICYVTDSPRGLMSAAWTVEEQPPRTSSGGAAVARAADRSTTRDKAGIRQAFTYLTVLYFSAKQAGSVTKAPNYRRVG